MVTPPPQFDPLQVFGQILIGVGLGAAASNATLPYVAAGMAAIAGAYAAAVNRPKDETLTTVEAVNFILSRVMVSALVSVSLAAIIERFAPGFGLKWTVIPVALVLSYVGAKEAITRAWDWFVSILPKGKIDER